MSDVVRLGIVGAGSIALRGHLPHLTMEDVQDRVNVTAICDPVIERAEAAASKFGVSEAFESLEKMLDSGKVDAVSICSPIGLHYEQGLFAIENGVHVHFNKTMTTTVAEADEIIARAIELGVKLVASPGEMLRPQHKAIRELLLNNAIGTPTWAVTGAAAGTFHQDESSVRGGNDPLSNISPAWYFRRPGGGPLYDMTTYGLHALTGILGPARRVTAFSGIRIPEREFKGEFLPTDMDDNSFLVLDFGQSMYSFVYGAAAGALPIEGRAMFFGTEGVINGTAMNGVPIEYPGADLDAQFGYKAATALPHVTGEHRGMAEAHVFEDVMQLVDLIREGTPTPATPEHARHVIEIIEKAYESASTGKAQDLTTTFELSI